MSNIHRTYASPPGTWPRLELQRLPADPAAPDPVQPEETTIVDPPLPPSRFPEGTSPTERVDLACNTPTTDSYLIEIRVAAYRAAARFLRKRGNVHAASADLLDFHANGMADALEREVDGEFGSPL